MAKSKLQDFGEPSINPSLDILINSINAEARLSPFGFILIKNRIISLLENRLRTQHYFKNHPNINTIPITSPVIITGFQRTGTSFLQRVLSFHPELRSMRTWETLNPSPFPSDSTNQKRKKKAKIASRGLQYISPDFSSIHSVQYDQPEEEVLLFDMTFQSAVPEALLNVPGYVNWVQSVDQKVPYSYVKKMLQFLLWHDYKPRWLLKTPFHMENIPVVNEIFPDCKIIHTYRDPLKTLPSFCNLIYHSRSLFSDSVSAHDIGSYLLLKTSKTINDALPFLLRENVFNVSYKELINNTEKVISEILDFSSLRNDTEIRDMLIRQIEKIKKIQKKRHHYTPELFGLESDSITEEFKNYRTQFNIPIEKS